MAIKIYQTQIRPTTEVKERASTPGMKISLDTAAAPGRAFGNMMAAGEKLYVKYEQQKSENEVIEAGKNIDQNVISDHPTGGSSYSKKGLGTTVNELSESTKPDEALASYKSAWQSEYDRIVPTLKGKFSKQLFKNYMNKRFISESGSIRDNTFVNFRNESRVLKINELDNITKRLSNNEKGTLPHNQALTDFNAFFSSQSNYDLFGDKFKQLEFQTLNNIDVLKIQADLSKDAKATLKKFNAGEYKNLDTENHARLKNKITLAAQQQALGEIGSDEERAKLGLESKVDLSENLKLFEGYETYKDVKLAVDVNNYVRGAVSQVHTSKQSDLAQIKLYELKGTGDEIAAKRKANVVIQNAISERIKAVKENDIVGYINKIDPELADLDNRIQNSNDEETIKSLIKEKKLLLDQKFIELDIEESKQFYLSKSEVQAAVLTITSPDKTWQEKKATLLNFGELYGKENLPQIMKQMAGENLPEHFVIAMSTNSSALNQDILQSHDIKDLEKNALNETSASKKDITKRIANNLEKWEEVIENQNLGTEDAIKYKAMVEKTLYRVALLRIDNDKNNDWNKAVDSATDQFLSDYSIAPEKTYFIPQDVNGKFVNQGIVQTKSEAIKLDVEEGSYLDNFMGKDGYQHYASNSDIDGVSKEDIDIRVKSAIQNNNMWLLNDTSTGLVLHFTWFDGTKVPIVNSSGKKIEFKFLDTDYNAPGTNTPLTVIETYDVFEEPSA